MRGVLKVAQALLVASVLVTVSAQEADRMFLPAHTVDNLGSTRLMADADGGLHMALSAITSEGFYYSYCQPGCVETSELYEVHFATSGMGPVLALDLDPQGRPHILVNGHGTVGYAFCDGDCRVSDGWKYGTLFSYEPYGASDRAISGDTLAVGPDGRSHFLLHGARALIDQVHSTWYYTCAANCHLAGNWSGGLIEPEQNYTYADLEVRHDGALTAGFVAEVNYDLDMEYPIAAYMECQADCSRSDSWLTVGLTDAFDGFWMDTPPAMSMELTAQGKPRMTYLAMGEGGDPVLMWLYCDAPDCTVDTAWDGGILLDSSENTLGSGVHLTLDQAGGPRITYTVTGSILSAVCSSDCTGEGDWGLELIEAGSQIPADDIFLYSNCVIGMWFLKDGQSALLPDGRVATVYTAEDYSFGSSMSVDPSRPACPIGLDMSLGRLSLTTP